MPADQGMIDEVATANIKTIAGAGSWAAAQVMLNHPVHVNFMNLMTQKLAANVVEGKVSVADAVGQAQLLKADSNSSILSSLDQLDAGQVGQKTANTTPPETGLDIASLSAQLSSVLAFLQAQANGPAPVAK